MVMWVFYVGFAVVVLVGLSLFAKRGGSAGNSTSSLPPEALADRADPRKHWAQAAQALYQGILGDAGYWSQSDAVKRLSKGWSTSSRQELIELINSYIQGECNVAFDKLRIIFLARVGKAASWLDEQTSWGYAFQAIHDLQSNYRSWEELRDAMIEGRAEWYGGASEVPPQQNELSKAGYALAAANYFAAVPFR